MAFIAKTFRAQNELAEHIKAGHPSLFFASQTSTVIPYDKIESYLAKSGQAKDFYLANLSQLPAKMEMIDGDKLLVQGPVTWKDAKAFCVSHGREIMTSPTEELAAVLSGIATSATGERCFGYGAVRDHILELTYLDYQGKEQTLKRGQSLMDHKLFAPESAKQLLRAYQNDYTYFRHFKNAPFPRFEVATDLMAGTEGQLGAITQAVFKTAPVREIIYIFVNLPKWEKDDRAHLELFERVQKYRDKIYACEFVDENSLAYLPPEERPVQDRDIVYLEIDQAHFDQIYVELLCQLHHIKQEDFYEVPVAKCRAFRMNVPRAIFETNSRMGVTKMGTDVQVAPHQMAELMTYYRKWSGTQVKYNLFGHFGDAHLHFNFMPYPKDVDYCQSKLHELYHQVLEWKGSPFAEHGVGLIKRAFIAPFYQSSQQDLFQFLKQNMDPKNVFFPQGFMHV